MKHPTIRRNVEELESTMRSFVEGCRQRFMELGDDIERKAEFLRSHIAAESASHPPDDDLSHLSRRFEALYLEFRRIKDDEDDDESSCCLHVDQQHEATFRVYDNPLALAFDGCDCCGGDVKEGGEQRIEKCVAVVGNEGKWSMYWRPMVVGAVVGGVSVAVAVASVLDRYCVCCDYYASSVFPPPT